MTSHRKQPSPIKKAPVKKKASARKKKSKGWSVLLKIGVAGLFLVLLSPFYYGYVLRSFTSAWRWVSDMGGNPHYRTYKSFNIQIPDKYAIHGIDVSYAQGKIDWQKVKSMEEDSVHISFAFIKATEGVLSVDPYFQRNWREAPKVGIICGAYHYFKPSKNGKWQAKFFLQTVKIEKGDLPLVVDVEELNGVTPVKMRQELKDFLAYVQTKTRVKPIIYSGMSFYQDYLAGYFDENVLWVANYHQAELKINSKTNWLFWQHSDKATISGINHVVDFDAFKGDSAAFQKLLVQ
ncbi:glycoside hydrolase family 25 protein [Mucilaginibacter sp. McL0603]|uniref:glycoside hydrolase family 25 protein n=1 Tax=Mucilaginibacter sp. McL0603 TaxID=3415670 RepID=UPI003CE87CCA